MKNFKKIILTSGISLSGMFFNYGYSQEKDDYKVEKTVTDGEGRTYKLESSSYNSEGNLKSIYYDLKNPDIKTSVTYYPRTHGSFYDYGFNRYSLQNKSNTAKTTYQTTQPQNKTNSYNPNKTYYVPPKNKTNLGDVLNTTNAVLNLGLSIANLIENNKKQKNINTNYSAPPVNNPPTNYNSNPEENKKAFDEWLNGKDETENKKAFDEWLNESKSENLLEKKIKETETKKSLDEEVKIADEFFKEKGYNPWEPYKYKIVGTIEIGPNGEIIKKESQRPEITDEEKVILYYTYNAARDYPQTGPVIKGIETYSELTKEGGWDKKYEESKKIIGQPEEGAPENSFYYGTTKFQKDMKTGLYVAGEELAPEIIKGIENSIDTEKKIREEGVKNWLNQQIKEEKEVDFLFAKPIGDNTYYYFKLAGKEELYKNYNESSKLASYVAIKNSPFGDQIINIAKDFKEKAEEMEKNNAIWWDK